MVEGRGVLWISEAGGTNILPKYCGSTRARSNRCVMSWSSVVVMVTKPCADSGLGMGLCVS